MGPSAVAADRLRRLNHYRRRAQQLQAQEEKLHQALHPDISQTLQGKKLLVFKEMLRDAGFSDEKFIEDIVAGMPLVGELRPTGEIPPIDKPASITIKELWKTAKWARHALSGSIRSSGDEDLDSVVYQGSVVERDKGWARGPFTAQQLTERHGPLWIASRRFGMRHVAGIHRFAGAASGDKIGVVFLRK